MKTYSIIGGIDGTGKTSFLGILKEVDPIVGVVVDLDQAGNCIDKGVSFTQETTLSGRKTDTTAQKAKELGYHVRLFYIGLDTASESLARIANRVRRGGHDIPENNVTSQVTGSKKDSSKDESFCVLGT